MAREDSVRSPHGDWRAAVRHPQADARPRRAAQRRRRDDPAVPRRVAGQMASRPHHLVLRDLRAARSCARLPAVRRALRLPVQQLLRGRRPAPRPPAPRHAEPPVARRGPRLSRSRRRGARARAAVRFRRARSSWSSSASITSSSTRSCSSPTSSPTFAENPLEPAYGELAAAGLLRGRAAELASRPRRHRRDRRARRAASLSTRAPAPPRLPCAARARQPPRHQRGMARVHRRRRLSQRRRCGCPTAGTGSSRKGIAAPLYWRDDGDRVHPRRPSRDRLRGAGRARQLLRGRRLRALGRRAAADRGRMGGFRRLGRSQ